MSNYSPPLDDIDLVMSAVVDLAGLLDTPAYDGIDAESVRMVVQEAGRFMAEVVAPTNRDGDLIGSVWNADGTVTTPDSFKTAYKRYVESGFGAVPFDPDFGGGGFPWVASVAIQEQLTSANMAFSLCPLLTQGAIDAIAHHGSADQKALYLPKMISGEWSGTMNLTEPQAGSDVGALTTRAEPVGDGTFHITGQKIFITYGEQDLTENIVHLVLARTPGSPPGTKGISMFLVPKYLPDGAGNPGDRNDVRCVSIEHKVGIHGSPTCVLAFGDEGGAVGWLVGDEGDGMRNMFTMMNNARLSVGLEGLAIAERAHQQAVAYAVERHQGTAVGARRGTSSPIVDHADVRRMLLTQRAWIDAMRCLVYATAANLDRGSALAGTPEGDRAREQAELFIPLAKSLCTDVGVEMTSLAIQVHGGMGYVEETGVAQHWRDSRIAPIYEGTNGIQAADLVGRKLPMRGGGVVFDQLDAVAEVAAALRIVDDFAGFAAVLDEAVDATRRATEWLLENGAADPNQALAGSTPYLRMLGTVVCAGLMGRLGLAAGASEAPTDHTRAKTASVRFFGEQILPSAIGLERSVTAGAEVLFALTPEQLA
ncbi:MAG: acyl-CoA dehydrogenase [Acidimicrobiales bacterium]